MSDLYSLAKAIHIVGFITWLAGLFYIVRLFVYHAEASARPEAERDVLLPQLELMAGRLWKIITVPASLLTLAGGLAMVAQLSSIPVWLHIKFGLLIGLFAYHFACAKIRRKQAARVSKWSSTQLRLFNELATLLMVAIVFLAVFRSAISIALGVGGLIALGVALMMGVRVYRRIREGAAKTEAVAPATRQTPPAPGGSGGVSSVREGGRL